MNDMLTGGFMNGIAAVQQRNAERAEVADHNNMVDLVDEWKAYADKLQGVIDAQAIKLSLLNKDYESVKRHLSIKTRIDKELIDTFIVRINKLEESLVRQSADAFSLTKMRDLLIEELTEIAPSPTPLMDPAARLALHHADWAEFMETNVPPRYRHLTSKRFI